VLNATRHLIDDLIPRDRDTQPPAFTLDDKTSVLGSPRIPLWLLQNVLSGMTGPVVTPNELELRDNGLIRNYARTGNPIGERIIVVGDDGVRTGLEDNIRVTRHRLAASNAELVQHAGETLACYGCRPATSAEARPRFDLAPETTPAEARARLGLASEATP